MAVEKPKGTIVLISFISGSSYFQVSEQGPSIYFFKTDLKFLKDFIPLILLFNLFHNFTTHMEIHLDFNFVLAKNYLKLSFLSSVYINTWFDFEKQLKISR